MLLHAEAVVGVDLPRWAPAQWQYEDVAFIADSISAEVLTSRLQATGPSSLTLGDWQATGPAVQAQTSFRREQAAPATTPHRCPGQHAITTSTRRRVVRSRRWVDRGSWSGTTVPPSPASRPHSARFSPVRSRWLAPEACRASSREFGGEPPRKRASNEWYLAGRPTRHQGRVTPTTT